MINKFLSGAAIVASLLVSVTAAHADTQKGRCVVTAQVHGGKKFATVKCDRASAPGDYIIRSQVWEKDDKKAYANMARFAGRRFTCDISFKNKSRDGGMEWSHYKVENCK